MATMMKLRVKSGEKEGRNFWNDCGAIFLNTDAEGMVTSVTVRHDMFPNVEMVAFPPKEREDRS